MQNKPKERIDFLLPPGTRRRFVYDISRNVWLTLLESGPKGVYVKIHRRLAKPRRIVTPENREKTKLKKNNVLFDDSFIAQIHEIPVTDLVDIIICVGPNSKNVLPCFRSIKEYTRSDLYNLHIVCHTRDIANLPSEILDSNAHIVSHTMDLFNYSRANNLVLRQSTNDVVLLNDDTEVTENWLEKLRSDSKGIALTGAHTGYMRSGNPQMWEEGPSRVTNYPINMFCAYIPIRLRSVVGLLDEEYCYYGGEDVDYSCRALMNGFPLVISSAFVQHKDNQSFKESKELLIKESDRILDENYGIRAPFDLLSIKPKVSVIMATRNRPELLESAIQSVLQIDYENFEFVIIDDFSKQETNQVIYDYQQKDDRIIAVRLPKNVGSSKARAIGLRASQGQFALFTDDDDVVISNRISKPLEFMIQNPNLDVVYCNYNLVRQDGSFESFFADNFNLQSYLDMKFWVGLGMLFGRKKVFLDVPFMSIYDNAVDYDWVFRLIRKGYKIDLCPEIVMYYNRTGALRYHLAGSQNSIDLHETIQKREVLLQKMTRHD